MRIRFLYVFFFFINLQNFWISFHTSGDLCVEHKYWNTKVTPFFSFPQFFFFLVIGFLIEFHSPSFLIISRFFFFVFLGGVLVNSFKILFFEIPMFVFLIYCWFWSFLVFLACDHVSVLLNWSLVRLILVFAEWNRPDSGGFVLDFWSFCVLHPLSHSRKGMKKNEPKLWL